MSTIKTRKEIGDDGDIRLIVTRLLANSGGTGRIDLSFAMTVIHQRHFLLWLSNKLITTRKNPEEGQKTE